MSPETLSIFKTTPGAISLHEMFAIEWLTQQAPANGVSMDIGSNAGKAAIAQAAGYCRRKEIRKMACVDTVFDLENKEAWKDNHTQSGPKTTDWAWIYAPTFHADVIGRIERAGGGKVEVELLGESALTAIPRLGVGGVAFAFCDADNNQRWLVDGIVDALAPIMICGGIIAHHDFESQFIAPHEAQERLIQSGKFDRVMIPWEQFKRSVDDIGGEHAGNTSWHHKETERPMFVGAIRRK